MMVEEFRGKACLGQESLHTWQLTNEFHEKVSAVCCTPCPEDVLVARGCLDDLTSTFVGCRIISHNLQNSRLIPVTL